MPRSPQFSSAAPWPLPQGVVDLFFEDAAAKEREEHRLRVLFDLWSYSELIPPTFEYADTLASEAGTQLAEEMYRFVDRDGRTLALRPDLTIPTARVVGTRLFDQPMPLRLFYVGSVFRYEPPQAGRQREFTQAGIELIGAASPAADAEILALTIEALRTSGLTGFQIALGQMAFFRGLLDELSLPLGAQAQIQQAMDRKSAADLAQLVVELGISGARRDALLALPALQGGPAILETGTQYCLNEVMRAALERLHAIRRLLVAYRVADAVAFDLGETRGMQYYTGITFKGYVPGLGASVCSGGRYDDLIGHFGPALPAVGCALWLDRILLARQRQGLPRVVVKPTLLLAAGDKPDCLEMLQALRRTGLAVELEVTGRSEQAMIAYAEARSIERVAICSKDGSVRLVNLTGAGPVRRLTAAELMDEAMSWTR